MCFGDPDRIASEMLLAQSTHHLLRHSYMQEHVTPCVDASALLDKAT